ncbi:MAG: O-antigen ligase family protein [Bacteroidota bacterium]
MAQALFEVATPDASPAKQPSLMGRIKRALIKTFVREKLDNGVGYLLLSGMALLFAWLIGQFGFTAVVSLLAILVVIPTLMGSLFHVRFGLMTLIGASFFLILLKRLSGDPPLGLYVDAALVCGLFGIFIRQIRERNWDFLWNPVTMMLLLWWAYCMVELINPWTVSQTAWFYSVRGIGTWASIFVVSLYALKRVDHVRGFGMLVLSLGLLGALYGFWQEWRGLQEFEWNWIMENSDRFGRFYAFGRFRKFSFFAHPGIFGMLMGGLFVWTIGLLSRPNRQKRTLILLICSAVIFGGAMLLSGTRTAFVVVPVTLLFMVLLRPRLPMLLAAGSVLALGAAMAFMPTTHPVLQRYQTAFNPEDAISLQTRLRNQAYIQPFIQEHPIGAGMGATGEFGQQFSPYTLLSQFPSDSGYVRIAVETGWVGLLVYLSLMATMLLTGVRAYFRTRDERKRSWIAALMGFVCFMIIGHYAQETISELPLGLICFTAVAAAIRLPEAKA